MLGGGGLTPVVRVGDTVRRATGWWTPAVHALLRHLERAGFEGAPRVLGTDEEGREEILTFVAGEVVAPVDDAALVAAACLVRRFHDATTGFTAPPDAQWQYLTGAPEGGEVVCHNDLSPWNTISGQEGPRAFVDWDLAAPGTRLWDLGHAVWRFVPLFPGEDAVACGRRLRLFCDGYGLEERLELLEVVRRRQQALYDTAREWGSAGVPGWTEVWRDTRGEQWLASMQFLDEHRKEWETVLSP